MFFTICTYIHIANNFNQQNKSDNKNMKYLYLHRILFHKHKIHRKCFQILLSHLMCICVERFESQFVRSLHIEIKINNEKKLHRIWGKCSVVAASNQDVMNDAERYKISKLEFLRSLTPLSLCVCLIPSMNRIISNTLAALFALKLYTD